MENRTFGTLAAFLDMSRNAVMKPESVKDFIKIISKMGYNALMLYMEDTYPIKEEEMFGYLRGGYTEDELRDIDSFADTYGVEVIPAIQTLGHLGTLYRFRSRYDMDTDDVLMVGSDRTYELIDRMFSSLSGCLKSKRINIGMDEAFNLGRGNYLDKNGFEPTSVIMKKHLDRVVEIAKKYDYEVQMWSDMFFRGWSGRYYNPKCEMPKEYLELLPEGVAPVYWEYTHWKPDFIDGMIYNHKQLSDNIWFAGGAYTWIGFTPCNDFSIINTRAALEVCEKNGIDNVIMTTWGNDGAECSRYSILPTLMFAAEYYHGNRDMESIKAKFKSIVGVDFDEYMLLDLPNRIGYTEEGREEPDYSYSARVNFTRNPSKYMLYSDPFLGFYDYSVKDGEGETYKKIAKALADATKRAGDFKFVFRTLSALSDVLSIKYELGVKTREAYKRGDKSELIRMANEEYLPLVRKLRTLVRVFREQWMQENKPFGFEIHDARLGGLIERVGACRKRILDYTSGKLENIPELDTEIKALGAKGVSLEFSSYLDTISLNVK